MSLVAVRRLALVNPASAGGRTAGRVPELTSLMRAVDPEADIELTSGPGHATELVRQHIAAGGREVVAFGGDGTVNEVVAGLVAEDGTKMAADDLVLGVVHLGTGGDFSRGLGLPPDPESAISVALGGGTERVIDVGVARFRDAHNRDQVRGFASCANVGMSSEVVARVGGKLKRLGQTAGFAIATVGSLMRNRPRTLRIELHGEHSWDQKVVDVMIANNRYVGGGMMPAPRAELDDGQLDVVVIAAAGRARLLRTFPKIYDGSHVSDPLVRIERTAQVSISVPNLGRPEGVVLDGELVGHTPAQFRVLPSALRVRVPLA